MHHILKVQEILLNIFGHCYPGLGGDDFENAASSLAGLARTCRAFKEPALDVLWSELENLSALSRCLPDASSCTTRRDFLPQRKTYGFKRQLEQAEWDILRSYARRIWCIRDFGGLDRDSIKMITNTLGANPLVPSLRSLNCHYGIGDNPLSYLPFPSLTVLNITFMYGSDSHILQSLLGSCAKFSPNIRELHVHAHQPGFATNDIVSNHIFCWQSLQIVDCPEVALDMDTLIYLSHIPALTRLSFQLEDSETFVSSPALADQIVSSDTRLCFSHLGFLNLRSKFLDSISRLLPRMLLPAITEFWATVDTRRVSKHELALFLASVETSMGQKVQDWGLIQLCDVEDPPPPLRDSDGLLLDMDDLRPCMSFSNLRRMSVDLEWNVNLMDSDVLELASAWPQLEELLINQAWGWNTSGGITPDGLRRLLKAHPSLDRIALAVDTRGCVELPPRRMSPAPQATRPGKPFSIDVVDSVIEAESIPAMAAFLASIVPGFNFAFTAWEGCGVMGNLDMTYRKNWKDVHDRATRDIRAFSDLVDLRAGHARILQVEAPGP